MDKLLERIKWVLIQNKTLDASVVAKALIREIETTHRIINPDIVTEEMLESCFSALPEHYDPPDMKRRPWHAFKARRRYIAMAKASPKIDVD